MERSAMRDPGAGVVPHFADRSCGLRSTDRIDRMRPSFYIACMAPREIIKLPDPRLRLVGKPVKAIDDRVRSLVADMFDTMYAAPGIGLAAIQLGVAQRVI